VTTAPAAGAAWSVRPGPGGARSAGGGGAIRACRGPDGARAAALSSARMWRISVRVGASSGVPVGYPDTSGTGGA
jgi:hypothetical protein